MNREIILGIIVGVLLMSTISIIIFIKIDNSKDDNKACYYYVSDDEVKLDGINPSEVDLYSSEDGRFFFLNKETREQVLECS